MRWSTPAPLFCALLLVSPALADQPDGAAGLSVQLQTDKTDLRVEPGKKVPVTIQVRDPEGQGVEGLQVELRASGGGVGPCAEAGGGRYTADYEMPAEKHPQAIILAAKVKGAPPGWIVLRLLSPTELPTTTSKPRVQVTLELGGRIYGPARSDNRGRVTIPVEVGPGETEAKAVAVDEFGNRRERTVSIPLPSVRRLLGFAERTTLAADGKDATDIYLISVQPSGAPDEALKVVAVRKGGKLSASRQIQPGLFHLRYTAPAKLDRTRIPLVLAAKGDTKLSRQKFVFSLTAGRPARLSLTADEASLFADGRSHTRLSLLITDQAGNPLEGQRPSLACDRGTPKVVRELGAGRYSARYLAPASEPGQAICKASLDRSAAQALVAEVRITLKPPIPARLEAAAEIDRLPMDGKARTRIDIVVYDAAGNPLDGARVEVGTAIGGVDPVSADGSGRYHASYTAPRGEESTRVRIRITAGQGDAQITEDVVIGLDGIAPPPPPTPWVTLGPSGALLTNFGRLLSGGFSVDAAVRIPGSQGYLYVGLESGYRYGRARDSLPLSAQSIVTEVGYSPLHLNLVFKPLPYAVATPLLGLGGGLEFVQWSIRDPGGIRERSHALLLGSLALVGLEIRLGPGALVLSARYLYAFLRDEAENDQSTDRAGSRIKGSVGGLDVCLGYHMHF